MTIGFLCVHVYVQWVGGIVGGLIGLRVVVVDCSSCVLMCDVYECKQCGISIANYIRPNILK